jgi:hypothetical protein
MFSNFYLVKNHKILNSSITPEARENISADLESLENNQLLPNKISHRSVPTAKLGERASLQRKIAEHNPVHFCLCIRVG